MSKLQPPPFSNQLHYENSGPVKLSPLFENLVGGSALLIPSRKGGGGVRGGIMLWLMNEYERINK